MLNIKRNLKLSSEDFNSISHTEMISQMIRRQYTCYGTHGEIEELAAYLDDQAKGPWYLSHRDRGPETVYSVLYLFAEEDIKVLRKFEAKHNT